MMKHLCTKYAVKGPSYELIKSFISAIAKAVFRQELESVRTLHKKAFG